MADGQGEGPSTSRDPVSTKLRILNSPVVMRGQTHKSSTHSTATLDHREAIRLQQAESEKAMARQKRTGQSRNAWEEKILPRASRWDALSSSERDRAILAFMQAGPSESDEEYGGDEDELDDVLMETLLNAEFEDGTKGQNILEPDDLSNIIRVQVPSDINMDDC
ncbi:uncharacterized protein EI90DRAFT_3054662 [Cantharellus anzutake]|uniref:uncharacterized protein n=1 Tax=Cantharellus anzutake TaxID=1750568 RepID=UPI0019061251|nr:uncharacterized protein EI90DRAFT_3081995 [Cantharellus anzutake]XP_038917155.1 uncharacterized protein EI90DRAFT_3054662 [Cantharellus anzutake]KAF8319525.1 hypothetical protein EI90DRAFT_3081995 [Cantharellus anzutake]KAF8332861.1 hypothetical protein EI90DRAFT_3054662 [Cantharellus anzutake]